MFPRRGTRPGMTSTTALFGGKYDGHYKKDAKNPTHFRIPEVGEGASHPLRRETEGLYDRHDLPLPE